MNYEELAKLAEMTVEEVKFTLVDLLRANRIVGLFDAKKALTEVRNSIVREIERRTAVNQKSLTIASEIAEKYGFDTSLISYTGQGYFNVKCLPRLPPNLSERDREILLSTTRLPIPEKIKFTSSKDLPKGIGKGMESEFVREWKCTHSHCYCPKEVETALLTGITPVFHASINALNRLGIEVEKCSFNSDRYAVFIIAN